MFRKILIIFSILILISTSCFGAVYFVSSADGDDTDDGTTMDDGPGAGTGAWATVEHAMEAGALNAGDYVFVRRTHSEVPVSDIAGGYSGTSVAPITVMGWPRAAIIDTTITEGDWTNGSHVVDNVVGITPDREGHIGRFATAPDGFQYLIIAVLYESGVDGMGAGDEFTLLSSTTNVTQTKNGKIWGFTDDLDTTGTIQYARDSSLVWVENDNITDDDGGDAEIDAGAESAVGFIIDRPYAGGTVTGVDGKFQIEADDDWVADMGTKYGFDDSGWTIKETTWDADAHDVPLIDFNDGDVNFVLSRLYNVIKNMEFKDSTDGGGIIYSYNLWERCAFQGILVKQTTQTDACITTGNGGLIVFDRVIVEGTGVSSSNQRGIQLSGYYGVTITNSAVLNTGSTGLAISVGNVSLSNLNIGVAVPTLGSNIYTSSSTVIGRDVYLDGTNVYVAQGYNYRPSNIPLLKIANYGKVLGAYKEWYFVGNSEKVAVTGVTPNKKLSDYIIEYTPHTTSAGKQAEISWKTKVFESRKTYDAGTYNVKVWIYNDTGNTLNDTTFSDDILMRCRAEAGNYGDATTEYVSMPWTYSDEIDILDAADADDWDYLQCDSVVVDQASKIYCEVLVSTYDAEADVILIDPVTTNP